MERRSAPIIILSLALSSSSMLTLRLLERAANKAASLTKLAKSAPENPGVPRAIGHNFYVIFNGYFCKWTRKICSRLGYQARELQPDDQNDQALIRQDQVRQGGWLQRLL